LTAAIHALRQPRLLVAVDHEGGRVQRFRDGFTRLPAVRRLGELYDRDRMRAKQLARVTGWLMAAELRAVGVDFSFAPVLDLDHGVSGIIGDRAFHRDPDAVADLAHAYASGIRKPAWKRSANIFRDTAESPPIRTWNCQSIRALTIWLLPICWRSSG